MAKLSLDVKKAYFAQHRQSNYAASLRLEGSKIPVNSTDPLMPTRDAALEAIRQLKD